MSADNGIYILQTKDQYRVVHLQAIENIYWSFIDGDWRNKDYKKRKYVPTRVIEMWGDCKYTRSRGVALEIAYNMASKLPICEYGVNIIKYNKTWRQITYDATNYAKREIDYIKKNEIRWCNTENLEKIAQGTYCFDR